MSREKIYHETVKKLFGDTDFSLSNTDPDFSEILNKFIFRCSYS